MFSRIRPLWVASGAVLYVAFAALRSNEKGGLFHALLLLLPVALWLAWRLTAPPTRGEDLVDPDARSAARACAVGAAIVLAARAGKESPAFVALENGGAAVASIASFVALARIGSLGGLVTAPPSARRLDAAAFGSLLWTVAIALPAARAASEERTAELDPLFIDYATVAASTASLAMSLATAWRVRVARRLELGVADRATAALLFTVTALGIGVAAALAKVARPERLLPLASVFASLAVAASAVAPQADALSRALRTVLAVALLTTPIAVFFVRAAMSTPGAGPYAIFLGCAVASVAGLLSPVVARKLAPEGARWLGALEAATRAALTPDPESALESALLALRGASGRTASDPALYHLTLPEVVTVDRAGYMRREKAELPPTLVELADHEPERILRLEVARAAEVRRPEVRPLVLWFEQRGYSAIAVVRDDMGSVGALAIPAGSRKAPMTLEEVRALRTLADRLGAIIGASAQLSRSRARELEARAEIEKDRAEIEVLRKRSERSSEQLAAVARMLARPAQVAAYSPAARTALDQIERLSKALRPIALLSAPGVDAMAWAAAAHLASPHADGPLAIVDGTDPGEHDLERFRDPATSPMRAAAQGSLVLVDAHALPIAVQSYIGAALPESAGLIVSVPNTVDALVAAGVMSERLADKLGDRAVALPTLASRPEDLRALASERLARIGVRLQSRPLGIDPAALVVLLEHTWPGNDAELHAVLLRAALIATGDVLTARDLERVGLSLSRDAPEPRPIPLRGGKKRRP
jgi:hypothetical protein